MIMFFKCNEFNVYILKYEIKIMLLLNSDPKSESALPKHQQLITRLFYSILQKTTLKDVILEFFV
jgi:hypothetical protein